MEGTRSRSQDTTMVRNEDPVGVDDNIQHMHEKNIPQSTMTISNMIRKITRRSYTIDVGGDRYFFTDSDVETQNFELGFKSEAKFYENFVSSGKEKDRLKTLFIHYFPTHSNYKNIEFKDKKDIDTIKKALRYRIENLSKSIHYENPTFIDMSIWLIYRNIQKILDYLETYTIPIKPPSSEPEEGISDDDLFRILLGMMWYISRPTRISSKDTKKTIRKAISTIRNLHPPIDQLPSTSSLLQHLKTMIEITTVDEAFKTAGKWTISGGGDSKISKMTEMVFTILNNERSLNRGEDIIQQINDSLNEETGESFENLTHKFIQETFNDVYTMIHEFITTSSPYILSIENISILLQNIQDDETKLLTDVDSNIIVLIEELSLFLQTKRNSSSMEEFMKPFIELEKTSNPVFLYTSPKSSTNTLMITSTYLENEDVGITRGMLSLLWLILVKENILLEK